MKPRPDRRGHSRLQLVPPQREEAGEGVGQAEAEELVGHADAAIAERKSLVAAQAFAGMILEKPAGGGDVRLARRHAAVEFRQDRFIVLEVAVHHGDDLADGRQPAFDDSRSEPAAVVPRDQAHPAVVRGRSRALPPPSRRASRHRRK